MSNKIVYYGNQPYTETRKKSGAILLEPVYKGDDDTRTPLKLYSVEELMEEIVKRLESKE